MGDKLEYLGYKTTIKYNATDKLLHGKIEGVSDLIMFESNNVNDIEEAFHRAVDSYILEYDHVRDHEQENHFIIGFIIGFILTCVLIIVCFAIFGN